MTKIPDSNFANGDMRVGGSVENFHLSVRVGPALHFLFTFCFVLQDPPHPLPAAAAALANAPPISDSDASLSPSESVPESFTFDPLASPNGCRQAGHLKCSAGPAFNLEKQKRQKL